MSMLMTVDMRNIYAAAQRSFELRTQLCLQLSLLHRTAVIAFGEGHIVRQKKSVVVQQAAHLLLGQHRRHAAHQRKMHADAQARILLRQTHSLLPARRTRHQRGAGDKALLMPLDNPCINQGMQTKIICVDN